MDALELLLNRQSDSKLSFPGPSRAQLKVIQQAALKVPDHGALTPWQFITVEEEERAQLGEIFARSATHHQLDDKVIERAKVLAERAPMVIICVAKYQEHAKVPWVEQVASASCAVMAMQQAAFAQGLAGIWRTGSYARCEIVKKALGLKQEDEIVGFLYLGTATIDCPKRRRHDPALYFSSLSALS